jgi:hypothetical protein
MEGIQGYRDKGKGIKIKGMGEKGQSGTKFQFIWTSGFRVED